MAEIKGNCFFSGFLRSGSVSVKPWMDFSATGSLQRQVSSHAFEVRLPFSRSNVWSVWNIRFPQSLDFRFANLLVFRFSKRSRQILFGDKRKLRGFDHSFRGKVYSLILMVSAGSLPKLARVLEASSKQWFYWWLHHRELPVRRIGDDLWEIFFPTQFLDGFSISFCTKVRVEIHSFLA